MNSSNKKICFVSIEYPPDWGGVSKSSRRVVKMLTEIGFSVHVFSPKICKGDVRTASVDTQEIDGVSVHRVPIGVDFVPGKGFSHEDAVRFSKVIDAVDRTIGFDIFHGYYLTAVTPCLLLASRKSRPVIASIRGDDGFSLVKEKPDLIRQILEESTWITSVSTDSISRVNKLTDVSAKSSFIPNSMVPDYSRRWSLQDNNIGVVGTVCTFRPKKNIPSLIKAYSKLPCDIRRKLLLVGDFIPNDVTSKIAVEEAIQRCAVADEIEITGYVENSIVNKYACEMNVFVLPSLHEGFPNTILEVAATGVPIIATAVDGVKDICQGKDYVCLVPPGDTEALAYAVREVLSSPEFARRLSRGSVELAASYTPATEKACWQNLYEKLLS